MASRWEAGGVLEDFKKGAGFPQVGKGLGDLPTTGKIGLSPPLWPPSIVLTQKCCADFAILMQFLAILAKLCLHHSPL